MYDAHGVQYMVCMVCMGWLARMVRRVCRAYMMYTTCMVGLVCMAGMVCMVRPPHVVYALNLPGTRGMSGVYDGHGVYGVIVCDCA